MSEASTPLDALDEDEHQALDLLDELRCGADWIEAQRGEGGPANARLDAALAELGEDRDALDEAADRALEALARVVTIVARSQLDAATTLAQTDDYGQLSPELVTEVEAILDADPRHAGALAPAVESAGVFLGLTRESVAWAVLLVLGGRADAEDAGAPEALSRCSKALAERLDAAWPTPVEPAAPPKTITPALRAFRSATVRLAGPELRARALAAEHPDRLDLATKLVATQRDVGTLVATFDEARAALDAAKIDDDPTAALDGPKRPFTIMHVVLAALVLGLTLWHYLWR